jgi:hypothetical protein
MGVFQKTSKAQVIVFTCVARYHLGLGEFCRLLAFIHHEGSKFQHTTKASVTGALIANMKGLGDNIGRLFSQRLGVAWFLKVVGWLVHRRLLNPLWSKGFGGAIFYKSILNQAFKKPVVVAGAGHTRLNAVKAQVVVSVIANGAVVVVGRDHASAVVAIYTEGTICSVILGKPKGICRLWRFDRQGRRRNAMRARSLGVLRHGVGKRRAENSIQIAVTLRSLFLLRWGFGDGSCGSFGAGCRRGRSHLDTEFELRFGGTVELFVDGRVLTIQLHVASSAIRVALERQGKVGRNGEDLANLDGQNVMSVRVVEDSRQRARLIKED